MLGNDWKLVVEFGPVSPEQLMDDGQPYALRLAAVCTRWEHDCDSDENLLRSVSEGFNCPSLRKGVDYYGDTMWEVSDDLSTFTAYSDFIDALEDVVSAAIMTTIPKKLTLESTRD